MTLGLVGLPNAGKSTVFNALTRGASAVAPYPFCTIEPHVGAVPIPDPRLEALAAVIQPEKVTPGVLQVVDIAGLVEGAHRGEGLGNRFLAHIREVDAVLHVVRCFVDPHVSHVRGGPDPRRDVETVEAELLLADAATVESRLERTRRAAKGGDPAVLQEAAALEALLERLQRGIPARSVPGAPLNEEEDALAGELFLLTRKPVLFVANVGEDDAAGPSEPVRELEAVAAERGSRVVVLPGRLEADLADMDPEEAGAFRAELGVPDDALSRVIDAGRRLLGLITFYTVKGPETRAWLIREGTPAVSAAGRIHSDMEKGFIRAEVIPWDVLVNCGSFAAARSGGLVRSEGRDYIVQDGDVILFRFNVAPSARR